MKNSALLSSVRLSAAPLLLVATSAWADALPAPAEAPPPAKAAQEVIQDGAATPAAETPTGTETVEDDERMRRLATAVSAALEHFGAKRYQAALVHFDEALTLAAAAKQVATLQFNAAVCLFELGSYEAAEARFLLAAAADASAEAFLHAGFAAARSGAKERAREHLQKAKAFSLSSDEQALLLRLTADLAAADRYAEQQKFAKVLRFAFEAVDRREATLALRVLRQAAKQELIATAEQRANYRYALALAQHQLGHPEEALKELDAAIRWAPSDAEFPRYRAMLHEQLGHKEAALRDYQTAIAMGLAPELKGASEDAIVRLHPLKAPGWETGAQLSVGYDSNATQSGSAFARGIANQEANVQSPFALLYAQVGYRVRIAAATARGLAPSSWDLTPSVAVTNLTLSEASVRELSVTAAQASVRLRHAASLYTYWGVQLGAGAALTGLSAEQPFTRDASVAFTLSSETSPRWTTEASLSFAYVEGLGSNTVLSGPRVATFLSEGFRNDEVGVSLRAGGVYFGLGSEQFAADTSTLQRCARPLAAVVCDGLMFTVPLAYVAPQLLAQVDWSLTQHWLLQAQVGAEFRHYLDKSALLTPLGVVPESRKRRRDFRSELTLRGNYLVGSLALFLEQSALSSISNLQPDLSDPEHRFDYEDRNYMQFVSQLGVRGEF